MSSSDDERDDHLSNSLNNSNNRTQRQNDAFFENNVDDDQRHSASEVDEQGFNGVDSSSQHDYLVSNPIEGSADDINSTARFVPNLSMAPSSSSGDSATPSMTNTATAFVANPVGGIPPITSSSFSPSHGPSGLGALGGSLGLPSYDPSFKFTFYSHVHDIIQENSLEGQIKELLHSRSTAASNASGLWWLDVCGMRPSELHALAQLIPDIHPLTLEDIAQGEAREKCELYDKYLFVCLQTCSSQYFHQLGHKDINTGDKERRSATTSGSTTLSAPPVLVNELSTSLYILMLASGGMVTLHWQPIPHIRNTLKRLISNTGHQSPGPDWILYALVDDVVDEFQPGMQDIEHEVDCIDDLTLMLRSSDQADMLRRISHARKRVTRISRLLKPKGEVVKVLYRRCSDRLSPMTLLYLRDVQDHLLTMLNSLEQSAGTLDRSHSNYLAQISIELAEASNRMNFIVGKLTAAASVVLPMSLISGIWGMNVPVPGQSHTTFVEYGPFFAIISSMIVLMIGMYLYGRYRDWF